MPRWWRNRWLARAMPRKRASSSKPTTPRTKSSAAIFIGVLFRYGFLSVVVASAVGALLTGIPITYQVSSWTFGGTLVALAIVFGLAVYGLRIALAGRPLFQDDLAA